MSSGNISAQAKTASTSSFVSSIIFNSSVFGAEIAAFTLLRPYFHLIYEPRAYSPIGKRIDPLSHNLLKWPLGVYYADYTRIKKLNGMDSYFFVRFLRMAMKIWLPIWLLSWVILLPLTSVNTGVPGHTGLDVFIFGNISSDKRDRYWGHLLLAWIFTFWIGYNIKHEMAHFVSSRQHHLVDPAHSSSAQANTILITGIPRKYLTEQALMDLFSYLPGGVKKVWLNRDLKTMPELYSDQLKACKKLESAETQLLKTALKLHNKKLENEKSKAATTRISAESTTPLRTSENGGAKDKGHRRNQRDLDLAEKLVPKDQRPTHRLKPFTWLPFGIPFMGEKVDSIEWARDEITRTNTGLRHARKDYRADILSMDDSDNDTYPPLNSAFVLFNQQIAAFLAAQSLTHHEPYRMAQKYTEVAPDDVIWNNLGLNPYEQRVRLLISVGCTIGLIIAWTFPVVFIGALSNIHSLAATYKWLAWLDKLHSPAIGVIQGILPSLLLAILMLLLPIILRLLARFEGIPTRSGLELSLMNRYFSFQVIHSFLIVTLSSGIIAALPSFAKSPESIPTILAQKLPQASTFFLTYFVLQGFSGTAAGFLQLVPLLLYYVKLIILGTTPRSVFNIKYGPRTTTMGTTFPAVTLLVVIATAYSVISPIINGLAFATFAGFYMLYKFLFLWVNRTPHWQDTGGLFFPKAMQHMFVGLYIQHICLAALFFLNDSVPQGALMIVLTGFTFFFHLLIHNSYGPLIHDLPLTLADKSYGLRKDVSVEDAPDPESSRQQPSHLQAGSSGGRQRMSLLEPDVGPIPITTTPREMSDPEAGQIGRPDSLAVRDRNSSYPPSPAVGSPGEEGLKPRRRKRTGSDASGHTLDSVDTSESVRRAFTQEESEEVPDEDGPTDFNHPATARAPPVIWVPQDVLGLGEAETAVMKARGIHATTEGAKMNEQGQVEITTAPPDEQDEVD